MKDVFRQIAAKISTWTGSAGAFLLALTVIITWAITGPLFGFSNTWQLVINTGTTIVTFLMVFLIQNTQNRDGKAMQLKLDELIRSTHARNSFVDLEDLTDEELEALDEEFKLLHEQQKASEIMHKLHATIKKAHTSRKSLGQQAGHVLNVINPFDSPKNNK